MQGDSNKEEEDIIIVKSVPEVAQLYKQSFVWYEPDIYSTKFKPILELIEANNPLRTFTNYKDAADSIKAEKNPLIVIASPVNGEIFIKEISQNKKIFKIYIFGGDADSQKKLKSLDKRVIFVENDLNSLVGKIKVNLIKNEFPVFAPIFNDMDKSLINHLHYYLIGLIEFKSRSQAKKDLMVLAKETYPKNIDQIIQFDTEYVKKNNQMILNWYSKNSFVHRFVNNSLRIGDPDTILYCRFAIKELERAIEDEYKAKSKSFSGLLYRGSQISEEEWTKLTGNIGKDIEIYGFLSTTKNLKVALRFSGGDFITIIVPPGSGQGGPGFADIQEYSQFPEEEEILFNIRSRFTVLEAREDDIINGKKFRHLILLYGAKNISKFIKESNPFTEIKTTDSQIMNCQLCQKGKDSIQNSSLVYIKLEKPNELICADCMRKYQSKQENSKNLQSKTDNQNTEYKACQDQFKNDDECFSKRGSLFCDNYTGQFDFMKSPFLCLPAREIKKASSLEDKGNIRLNGLFMTYQKDLNIPFYGYECRSCKNNRLVNCFKCITCQEQDRTWCQKCFDQNNGCLNQQHHIVLENQPFSCWNQAMSDDEINHFKYHEEVMDLSKNKFQQGLVFMYTENYEGL